ncbi:DUF1385 domain-containing protein [Bellilinea sp.]|uniref:DUF1385 domain-containing protein n=1 Tax=Bellilinea sp. TaxID=2838785 RepID=UPI002ADE5A6C|nr:DUF1385 domain-containing protein [Bellilinea sp.]
MSTEKLKLSSYGGQALIEGVLMRGKYALVAAMRAPDGQIILETEELKGIYQSGFSQVPFLRGLILLWDALGLGTRYLTRSANLQSGEEEKIEGVSLYLTLAASLAIAIGLFFLTPAAVGKAIQNLTGISSFAMNLIEGILRLGGVVLYIWAIGRVPDIQRVFAYHGAEHKTINAFEAGADLKPETVKNFPLEHPRCGTSFLLTLIVLSVLVFSLVGNLPFGFLLLSRVLLIPVLAMLAYEYIRFTANHLDHPFIRWMIRPNLALQSLTTREPDLDILEVSIASFNAMLELEKKLQPRAIHPTTEPSPAGGGGGYQNPPE